MGSGDEGDRYRAPALDKGLDILELLAEQERGLTQAEIAKALGRTPGELFRMLDRLVRRGWVRRSDYDDRFHLGLKLFALANRHPPLRRLIETAAERMRDLARRAEQSCHLALHDGGTVLIVAQAEAPGLWALAVRVGTRVPLIDTASGHVLLAFQPPTRRERMLRERESLEGEAPLNARELGARLDAILARGHEVLPSRQTLGVTNLSFPVLAPDGSALAALTVPYLTRIDGHVAPSQETVLDLLEAVARQLSLAPSRPGVPLP